MTCIDISLSPSASSITRDVGSNLIISCTLKLSDSDEINLDDLKTSWPGWKDSAGEKVATQSVSISAKAKTITSRVKFQKSTADQSGEYKCSDNLDEQSKTLNVTFKEQIKFNDDETTANSMPLVRGTDTSFECKATPSDVTIKWTLPDGTITEGKFYDFISKKFITFQTFLNLTRVITLSIIPIFSSAGFYGPYGLGCALG